MTFSFSTNNHPPTLTASIFLWKQFMVSSGWTVSSSSDGSTYNPSGDVITSPSNGAGGLANKGTWFVLKQPNNTRSFCVQRNIYNYDYLWRIKYSVVGFTSGSPGSQRTPTAANNDQVLILGAGTDASPIFTAISLNNTTLQIGVDGYSNAFYFITYKTTANITYIGNVFIFDPILSNPIQDQDPYVIYFDTTINSLTQLNISNPINTCPTTYFRRGLSNQSFLKVPACTYTSYGQPNVIIPNILPVNAINGNIDTFPIYYAGSCGYYKPSIIHTGYKGISSIMKWNGTQGSNLNLLSINSFGDRIVFGDINLPWNGIAPSI
jgi:hypothetical protein